MINALPNGVEKKVSGETENDWPPLETLQGVLIWASVLMAGLAPLAVPALVSALVIVTLIQDLVEGRRLSHFLPRPKDNKAAYAALAFLAFALMTTTWADRPLYSVLSFAQVIFVGGGSLYVAGSLSERLLSLRRTRQIRLIRAAPLAWAVIAIYFLVEAITRDGITLFLFKHTPWLFDGLEEAFLRGANGQAFGTRDVFYNRNAGALLMTLAGVAATLRIWPRGTWYPMLILIALTTVIFVCYRSESATAQLALAIGLLVFTIAAWYPVQTRQALQVIFLTITLTAIPLSMLPMALSLDREARLPFSFRHRVVIWDDVAHLALKTPVFGIGVKATRFKAANFSPASANIEEKFKQKTHWHPHNGYLQIWLELGAIGALLFALTGTLLIGRINQLVTSIQAHALGLTAATLVMIGPGWGIWQPWLIGSIGLGWLILLMLRPLFENNV